jgi:glutamyl-tRNA reductase
MNFLLIGVNHRTAPIEVRERLVIPESRLADALRRLTQFPGVKEGLILSTCNRTEVLAHAANGSADLRGFLHAYFGSDAARYEQHFYELKGEHAVRHLFRVAASLDSMVLGEPQILGQVKEAYATARAVGAVHSQLDTLITRSLAVAKRVRTETAIGTEATSVASVAVELAKKIFGSLEGKSICLVGAGKMSELAARHLISSGAAATFVANRTYDRALELAERFGGQAILFEQLYELADRADIVITSTGAPFALFRREHGELFMTRRRNRPMFFIDIAVPRDVDPDLNKVDGVFVYDIDDLQSVVAAHLAGRQREAERAEAIIETEVQRFRERIQSLAVVPTIVSLQEHVEAIRQAEWERARGRLGQLTPEQEAAIEGLTRGIVNKLLHTPMSVLKTAARDAEGATVVEFIHRLFNLPDDRKRPGD